MEPQHRPMWAPIDTEFEFDEGGKPERVKPAYSGTTGHTAPYPPTYQADTNRWGLRLAPDRVSLDVDHYELKLGACTIEAAEDEWDAPLPPTVKVTARGPEDRGGKLVFRVPEGWYGSEKTLGQFGGDVELIANWSRFIAMGEHIRTGNQVKAYAEGGCGYAGDELQVFGPAGLIDLSPYVADLPVPFLDGMSSAARIAQTAGSPDDDPDREPNLGLVRLVAARSISHRTSSREYPGGLFGYAKDLRRAGAGSDFICRDLERVKLEGNAKEWTEAHLRKLTDEAVKVQAVSILASNSVVRAKQSGRMPALQRAYGPPLVDDGAVSDATDIDAPRKVVARREGQLIAPSPANPYDVATVLVSELGGVRTVDDVVWTWTGCDWQEQEDKIIRRQVYGRLAAAAYVKRGPDGEERLTPWTPDTGKVNKVIDALTAQTAMPASTPERTWISPEGAPCDGPDGDKGPFIPFRNGIYSVSTKRLHAPSPDFWARRSVACDFDPAAQCPEWLQFINASVPGDGSALTLAQFFGLALVGDTLNVQKGLLLYGVSRSGKGTALRVAEALAGEGRYSAPKLRDLTRDFGLQTSLGKSLISVGDARLGGVPRGDRAAIAENLLSVIAGDSVDVNRKGVVAMNANRFRSVVMIATNTTLDLGDSAAAGRFIAVTFPHSHLGKEDTGLGDRLLAELPGLVNWALQGFESVRKDRKVFESESGRAHLGDVRGTSSPEEEFWELFTESCPGGKVTVAEIETHWQRARYAPKDPRWLMRDLKDVKPAHAEFPKDGWKQAGRKVRGVWGVRLIEGPDMMPGMNVSLLRSA